MCIVLCLRDWEGGAVSCFVHAAGPSAWVVALLCGVHLVSVTFADSTGLWSLAGGPMLLWAVVGRRAVGQKETTTQDYFPQGDSIPHVAVHVRVGVAAGGHPESDGRSLCRRELAGAGVEDSLQEVSGAASSSPHILGGRRI